MVHIDGGLDVGILGFRINYGRGLVRVGGSGERQVAVREGYLRRIGRGKEGTV